MTRSKWKWTSAIVCSGMVLLSIVGWWKRNDGVVELDAESLHKVQQWLDSEPFVSLSIPTGLWPDEVTASDKEQLRVYANWANQGNKIPRAERCISIMLTSGPSLDRRVQLVYALEALGTEKSVPPLIEILLSESEKETLRMCAASALGVIGGPEAIRALRQALRDRSAYLRYAVCWGLAYTHEPSAAMYLREALNDDSDMVRQAAEMGLEQLLCR